MAEVPQKRKRSVLTLEKKLEIVRALDNGSSQRVVAENFGVAKSTVADIWKDRGRRLQMTVCVKLGEIFCLN